MAAETAVSFVLNTVSNLLREEVSLLVGVKGEVERLRDQLEWMRSFLKDAYNKRRRGDERTKQWERAVREVAYQVEDIIESYMIEINSRRQQPLRCCGILKPVERYARELKSRHKLGADIKQLKAKIQQISQNRTAYGLVDLGQSAPDSTMDPDLQERRTLSPRYGDSVVGGFQEHKQKILDEILKTNLTQLCVKSIVGMGGLGKTTLAKMVFNADDIKSFGIRAWVSVSKDYTLIQLLKDLTKQITESESDGVDESTPKERISEFDGMDESTLKERIYELLQGKRYFIVFDVIWETGICHLIEAILPNGSNSSRVLLTTRFMDVARFGDYSIEPYQLPCLNENEGLELFLKKAFRTTHDTIPKCPRGLEEIARRLVNKCGGLPLAIVVLGGLMSNKKMTPKAWLEEEERMDWESTQEEQQCLKILSLSYDDITNPNMRLCFLYMGVFPEDSLIEASQLVTLWVAEGFVPQLPNRMMEDTAVNYLDQLVQRSLIEVVKRDWDGSIVTCRIHDLLRDLCLKEAREDGFLHVFRGSTDLSSMGLEHNPVRLAFHYVAKVEGCCPGPDLRSLLIYEASEITREMFKGRTKLIVMHLAWINQYASDKFVIEFVLEETKAANHLRYLALTGIGLSKLPQSFGYIYPNLQTLDVRHTQVKQLPESLGNMKTLRHLYLSYDCKLPPNIANLTNLQTIDGGAHASGGWIEQSLAMLSSIQRLFILRLGDTQQEDFANALRKLKLLSSLDIHSDSDKTISAEYIRALSNNNRLFRLFLVGRIQQRQLPERHDFPQNLTVLELLYTELEKDPMPTLERLPNLASLQLDLLSYKGKELVCTAGGFLRLEELKLHGLPLLERWDLEDGAMPNLASLDLYQCDKLRLPEGLPNLKKLQKVGMVGSQDFEIRVVLEDWWKIKHVKSIQTREVGFLRLEKLDLIWLDELELWDLEDGAMPNVIYFSSSLSVSVKMFKMG